MACAITSLMLAAAIGVLAAGFTMLSGRKERSQVREGMARNSSHGRPVIA
jgi:hypothetical protein